MVDSPELVGTETCELLAEIWQAGIDRKCTLWVSGCKGLGRRRSSILPCKISFLTTRGPSTTSEGILSDAWGVYMTRSVSVAVYDRALKEGCSVTAYAELFRPRVLLQCMHLFLNRRNFRMADYDVKNMVFARCIKTVTGIFQQSDRSRSEFYRDEC